MKFTEKAEKVHATCKTHCQHSVKSLFAHCGRSAGKPENVGRSLPLFPASSGIFRNCLREKFVQNPFDLCGLCKSVALLPLFPAVLWVHRLAYPVATGKNAGDDAASQKRRATRNTGGLRVAGHFRQAVTTLACP